MESIAQINQWYLTQRDAIVEKYDRQAKSLRQGSRDYSQKHAAIVKAKAEEEKRLEVEYYKKLREAEEQQRQADINKAKAEADDYRKRSRTKDPRAKKKPAVSAAPAAMVEAAPASPEDKRRAQIEKLLEQRRAKKEALAQQVADKEVDAEEAEIEAAQEALPAAAQKLAEAKKVLAEIRKKKQQAGQKPDGAGGLARLLGGGKKRTRKKEAAAVVSIPSPLRAGAMVSATSGPQTGDVSMLAAFMGMGRNVTAGGVKPATFGALMPYSGGGRALAVIPTVMPAATGTTPTGDAGGGGGGLAPGGGGITGGGRHRSFAFDSSAWLALAGVGGGGRGGGLTGGGGGGLTGGGSRGMVPGGGTALAAMGRASPILNNIAKALAPVSLVLSLATKAVPLGIAFEMLAKTVIKVIGAYAKFYRFVFTGGGRQLESMRVYSDASASMARVFAMVDVSRYMMRRRMGDMLEPTARALANSRLHLEREMQQPTAIVQTSWNAFWALNDEILARQLHVFNAVTRPLAALLETMGAINPNPGGGTFDNWLDDVARYGQGLAARPRPDVNVNWGWMEPAMRFGRAVVRWATQF